MIYVIKLHIPLRAFFIFFHNDFITSNLIMNVTYFQFHLLKIIASSIKADLLTVVIIYLEPLQLFLLIFYGSNALLTRRNPGG